MYIFVKLKLSMVHKEQKENGEEKHGEHEVKHEDGDSHARHSPAKFRNKFFVSLILTIPILALSSLIQDFLGFTLVFPGDSYLLFLISSIIFFYGGWPFLSGAKKELKEQDVGMMTLIALAIVVAYVYSSSTVFGLEGDSFFWELATLIDIMLLGHWIEMKAVKSASRGLEKLSALIPDNAHLLKWENIIETAVDELKDDDVVLVKPGEKIPTDGVVVKGESSVNEAMLTGESELVPKKEGNEVIGGSINQNGSLRIRVEGTGEDSYLSQMINLVKEAQESKSKTQNLADKAAFWLTIIAISVGVITFFVWFFAGKEVAFAIERTATVLVITCPHALGLAMPLVVAASTTLSARNGILIKNRTAFENTRRISIVVFDKTGTLTKGEFSVKKVFVFSEDFNEDEVIRISAGLERNSEHSIGKGIVDEANNRGIEIPEVSDFEAKSGKGVEGRVEGKKITIAGPGYLEELGIKKPKDVEEVSGTTVFLVNLEEKEPTFVGAINLSDTIREGAFGLVENMKKEGVKVWMLTGDNEETAKSVAGELEIDGYFAGVLPDKKQDKIKELQEGGEYVAMVGDGINDAPALTQADVGIAISSGTDIAAETADIILVNDKLESISTLILLGKATYRKMLQNLGWATGYNIFAIPLAAGVLISYGILLSPAVGAVLMSLSTIIVAINARLLSVEK